jgi:hypothetical protein
MIAEMRFGGLFMAPIVPYAILATFPFLLIRWFATRSGLLKRVWHPALFEIALYLIALSVLFLYF